MFRSILFVLSVFSAANAFAYSHEKVESGESHKCSLRANSGETVDATFNRMILANTVNPAIRSFRQDVELQSGIVAILERVFGQGVNTPEAMIQVRSERVQLSATASMPELQSGSFGDELTWSAANELLAEVHFDQNLRTTVIISRLNGTGGPASSIRFDGQCR